MKLKSIKVLMALSLLALLGACGGGGSGAAPPGTTPTSPPPGSGVTACVWGSTSWDNCNWQ